MEIANKTILVIFGSKVLVNSFGIYSRLACPSRAMLCSPANARQSTRVPRPWKCHGMNGNVSRAELFDLKKAPAKRGGGLPSNTQEYVMKLNATQLKQTLNHYDPQCLPNAHPPVTKLNNLFGNNTFFFDATVPRVL